MSKKVFFDVERFAEFQHSFFKELHKYSGDVCVFVVRFQSFSCMEEVVESGMSKKVFFDVKRFPEFQHSFVKELHKYSGDVCVFVVRFHATCMF